MAVHGEGAVDRPADLPGDQVGGLVQAEEGFAGSRRVVAGQGRAPGRDGGAERGGESVVGGGGAAAVGDADEGERCGGCAGARHAGRVVCRPVCRMARRQVRRPVRRPFRRPVCRTVRRSVLRPVCRPVLRPVVLLSLRGQPAQDAGGRGDVAVAEAEGQGGRGGVLEDVEDLGAPADAACRADGLEGVAAQGEEVVAGGDRRHAEDLAEDVRDQAFGGRGRGVAAARDGGRLRQGAPVELAVGGERDAVDGGDGGRHHVGGQPEGERAAQGDRVGGVRAGGHDVRGEDGVADGVLPDDDAAGGDGREGPQRGLDLAGFDAEAADLHLVVGAALVPQEPLGGAAGEVAGTVHAGAGRAERVGDEALGGEPRPVQVAAGQLGSGDVHLPGDAGRHRAEPGVEDVQAEAGQGAPDEAPAPGGGAGGVERQVAGVHGGLGDPVHVDQLGAAVGVQGVPLGQAPEVERLAAEHDVPQRRPGGGRRGGPVRVRQLLERGGGPAQHGDALVGEEPQEAVGRAADVRGHQDEPAAVQEGSPQLPDGEVEREGVGHGPHVVGTEVEELAGGGEQVEDVAVRHDDALGAPGGARGVDDVRGVVRCRRTAGSPGEVRGRVGRGAAGPRDGEDGQAGDGRGRRSVGGAQQQRRPRVGEQRPDPVRRVLRVDGQVRGARREDAEERDHQVGGGRQADADQQPGAAAAPPQQACQPLGARVQFGVGQGVGPAGHGGGAGGAAGLCAEGVDEGGGAVGAVGRGAARTDPYELPPLLVAEDADGVERTVRGGQDPAQEGVEPLPVAREVGGFVERGVGVEGEGEVLGRRVRAQHEVLDGAGRVVAQPGGAGAERHVRVEGHDVGRGAEDAVVAVPRAPVAAEVLQAVAPVGAAGVDRRAGASEHGEEGVPGRARDAQRHDGGDHAGGGRGRAAVPVGHRQPEHGLGRAGDQAGVRGERGDHHARPRHAVAAREGGEPFPQPVVRVPGLAERHAGRGQGRVGEAGHVGEVRAGVAPVAAVLGEGGRGAVAAVLLDEGVEAAEGGGGRGAAGGQRAVHLGGAADEQQRSDAVGDDVVQLPEPHVAVGGEAEHRVALDLARGGVQRRVDAGACPLPRRLVGVGRAGEVDERHGRVGPGADPLPGPVVVLTEVGAQRVRLGEGAADGFLEQGRFEGAPQLQGLRVGVGELRDVQPLAVPDAGLAFGEGEPARGAGG